MPRQRSVRQLTGNHRRQSYQNLQQGEYRVICDPTTNNEVNNLRLRFQKEIVSSTRVRTTMVNNIVMLLLGSEIADHQEDKDRLYDDALFLFS
mmetsp:Transcript_3720/g.4880  ORF Transcript_3720/g.4880 Transcript_3720/m.4880 type:complete len:93 (+) Transcript_3720:97-375(+)